MRSPSLSVLALLASASLVAGATATGQENQRAQRQDAALTVIDLGRIGPARRTPGEPRVGAPAARPTRQVLLNALRLAQKPATDLGETFRITPANTQHGPISAYLECGGYLRHRTTGGQNSWSCQPSGSGVEMDFDFQSLSPNSTFLVTLDHAFSGLDVHTVVAGKEHVSTIKNPDRPLLLVFQTEANQAVASIRFRNVKPGAGIPFNDTVFYALELSRLK